MNLSNFVLDVFSRTPSMPPSEYVKTRMSVSAFSFHHAANKARAQIDCIEPGKERRASYVRPAQY